VLVGIKAGKNNEDERKKQINQTKSQNGKINGLLEQQKFKPYPDKINIRPDR
jgi:hypothetical protein